MKDVKVSYLGNSSYYTLISIPNHNFNYDELEDMITVLHEENPFTTIVIYTHSEPPRVLIYSDRIEELVDVKKKIQEKVKEIANRA